MNLHAALSGFPLPLAITLSVIEFLWWWQQKPQWNQSAKILLSALGGGVILAYTSGWIASLSLPELSSLIEDALEAHFSFARAVLFSVVPLTALRILAERTTSRAKVFWWGYRTVLIGTLLFIVITGRLGGQLVFDHGVGVRAVSDQGEDRENEE